MSKKKGIAFSERYAWVVVRKSNDSIVTEAGIAFDIDKRCPDIIRINPIYKDEYENKRVLVTYSRLEK